MLVTLRGSRVNKFLCHITHTKGYIAVREENYKTLRQTFSYTIPTSDYKSNQANNLDSFYLNSKKQDFHLYLRPITF